MSGLINIDSAFFFYASHLFEASFEAFLMFYFFKNFIGVPRLNKVFLLACFFCLDFVTTYFEQLHPFIYLAILISVLTLISFSFLGSTKLRLQAAALYFIMTLFSEKVVIYVSDAIYILSSNFQHSDSLKIIFFYFCSDILQFFFVYNVVQLRKGLNKQFYLTFLMTLSLVVINLILIYNSLLVIFLEVNKIYISLTILSIFVILFFSYFVIQLVEKMARHYQLDFENRTLNQQLHYQKMTQDKMLKAQKEVRSLKHDLRNHLVSLSYLVKKNDLPSTEIYLKELLAMESLADPTSFTENLVIDALLTQLEERCLIENIHLDLVVKPLNIKEIKDIDLAILFGNAFDNALEAVSPLPEDQKKICLSMHFKKNYLFITLKNTQNNHYHFHSDYSYPTTKENKKNHGFGLKNMEQVVSKYDGQLKIKNEKETFTLVLVLKDAL